MGDKAMTYSNGKMKRAGDTDTVDFDGHVNLGNADSDNIDFKGDVASHILPNVTETYDLGSTSKMWRKGYFESITQRHITTAKYRATDSLQRFVRWDSTGSNEYDPGADNPGGPGVNNKFIAPADGELLSVKVRTTSSAGSTVIRFHKASNSNENLTITATETPASQTISANTTYTFTFSSSAFSAGEILGISIDPTNAPNDTNVTCVWLFDWNA